MNRKDYYKILGVKENATEREIKETYKKLVTEYHPDKYRDNPLQSLAEEKLREINEAYEILGNPEKRKAYDDGRVPGTGDEDIQIIEIFKKAEEFFSRRQFESARKELGKIIAIDPDIFEAHFMTGLCYRNQGKQSEARKAFEKVIAIVPEAHGSYNQIGLCYLDENNTEKALYYFKKASQLAPEESLYLENAGHACAQAKDTNNALMYFNEALKIAPDRAEIYMYVCYICAENGWFENADRHFQRAKSIDPANPLVLEWEEAVKNVQKQEQHYMQLSSQGNHEVESLLSCMAGCCLAGILESICPGSSGCIRG